MAKLGVMQSLWAQGRAAIERVVSGKRSADFQDARWQSVFGSALTMSQRSLRDPYTEHAAVQSAIRARANTMSQVPFVVARKSSNDPNDAGVPVGPNDPYQRVFEQPNTYMSCCDFVTALVTNTDLYGEYLVILINDQDNGYDPTRPPTTMWVVQKPGKVQHIVKDGRIEAWRDDSAGKTYRAQQVVHSRLYSPSSEWRGVSPVKAFRATLQADVKGRDYQNSYFDNGANPGGVITTDFDPDPDQRAQIREQFEDRHRGVSKAGRVALLPRSMQYHQIKMALADLQFPELRRATVEEILSLYAVPKQEVSLIEDVNRATAEIVRQTWWQNSLIPDLTRMGRSFAPIFRNARTGSGNLVGAFDLSGVRALEDSNLERAERAKQLSELGYGLNDINDRVGLGMPDVTWGDEPLRAPNLVPISTLHDAPGQFIPQPAAAAAKARGLTSRQIRAKAVASKREMREHYWRKFHHPAENLLLAGVRRYLRAAKEEQVEKFNEWAASRTEPLGEAAGGRDAPLRPNEIDEFILSRERHEELMRQHAAQPLGRIAISALKNLEKQLGGFAVLTPDLDTPLLRAHIRQRLASMIKVARDDQDRIRRVLLKTVADEGFSAVKGVQRAIRAEYRDMSFGRALTIARTETGSLSSVIRFDGMKSEGVERHEWTTARDDLVRPEDGDKGANHRVLHGEIRKIGKPFSNGLRYPHDPMGSASEVINCRCATFPLPDEEDEV